MPAGYFPCKRLPGRAMQTRLVHLHEGDMIGLAITDPNAVVEVCLLPAQVTALIAKLQALKNEVRRQ